MLNNLMKYVGYSLNLMSLGRAELYDFLLSQIQRRVSKDERYDFPYFASSGSD